MVACKPLPRSPAFARRRSGWECWARHWRATATAFQPQAPSVPHSTTATPGSSWWRTTGVVLLMVLQE
eukprot:210148-Alexandrium_andersonii.AAC.1